MANGPRMDDQGTNRTGGGLIRLLRLITLMLVGAYLGRWALSEIFVSGDDYEFELTNWLVGEICGALCGLSTELLLRRQNPLSPRFNLKELLVAMALFALMLCAFTIRW